jgi:putative hydrolase of the HAD superfamily
MGCSVPRLRAVIFDWGGTLTPWHTFDLAEQWAVYARVVHRDDDRASADLATRIFAAEGAAWQRARTGQGSAHMDDLLREVGLDLADVLHEAALTAYRQFWEPHTFTDAQVRPVLGRAAREGDPRRHPVEHDLVEGVPPWRIRTGRGPRPD